MRKEDSPSNSRAGLTVTLPLSRHNALKFNPSRGLSTRTGTSFTTYGIACQYRWGKGFQDPLPGSGCLPLNRPVPDSSG